MGQALYRKYRSKSLAEIIGQDHITDTLARAVKVGRISHAYLFTGPRGVGKTSVARILAHEINGLPYAHEDNHIDIIEIDAASNRGIDEIRDLREKVYMAPVTAKYKVYIIDEVHMLTPQAFNALLKTLEEPPQHVVFILATTEAHKLPETIISRTQRHTFRPVEPSKVVAHLRDIATAEKITVDDDALGLFAAHGGGSFRDSISLLDQASGQGHITRQVAEMLIGMPPDDAIDELISAVASGDRSHIVERLESLLGQGFQASAVARRLSQTLRRQFLNKDGPLTDDMALRLMARLIDVPAAQAPALLLEVILFEAMPAAPAARPPVNLTPQKSEIVQKPAAVEPAAISPKPARPDLVPAKKAAAKVSGSKTVALDPAVWPKVLESLKSNHNTLYGVMRMAVPDFGSGDLTLRFRFAFHQKRMNEAKHRKIIGDILLDLTGREVIIECLHDPDAVLAAGPIGSSPAPDLSEVSIPTESLTTISNIFGGGELLES